MSEMDPRLLAAFDALRAESAAAPDPVSTERARAAMHVARAAQPELGGLALLAARVRHALRPPRLLAAVGGLATGLAVVSLLGWSAPAGTPLHGVRVAHEAVVLALPGSDRIGLDLDYAEARLREAQAQAGSRSSLDEAAGLLDDARQHLAAGSLRWPRWQDDEKLLGDLRRNDEGGENGGTTPGGSGGSSTSSESSSTSTQSEGESSSTTTQSEQQSSTTSQSSSSDGESSSSTSRSSDSGVSDR